MEEVRPGETLEHGVKVVDLHAMHSGAKLQPIAARYIPVEWVPPGRSPLQLAYTFEPYEEARKDTEKARLPFKVCPNFLNCQKSKVSYHRSRPSISRTKAIYMATSVFVDRLFHPCHSAKSST